MKIIITGSSGGIGKAVCERFLSLGHTVYGIDIKPAEIDHPMYIHFQTDIKNADTLPDINDAEIIFNNAGTQNSGDDIGNNLRGTINVTENIRRAVRLNRFYSTPRLPRYRVRNSLNTPLQRPGCWDI